MQSMQCCINIRYLLVHAWKRKGITLLLVDNIYVCYFIPEFSSLFGEVKVIYNEVIRACLFVSRLFVSWTKLVICIVIPDRVMW
jgi:hypothetical protein